MKWSILAAVAMTSTTPAAAVTIVAANRMLDVASGRYVDKGKMIGLKQRQTFQRAVRAGVKMIFGTDAGVYPHGQNARQFAKMVQWGMTPLQAIQAATLNASALARSDVGALDPGRYGDIVAVHGDPLRNVIVLEHVDAMIKGGELVKAPGIK